MNCKPGDLAVIVARPIDGIPQDDAFIGKLIEVDECNSYIDCWTYKGPRIFCPLRGELAAIDDSVLRPIRDPGDDVPDESQAWLPPVPTPYLERA